MNNLVTSSNETQSSASAWNVPNKISAARLCIAVFVFLFLEMGWFRVSLVLFLIAAGTDWMDGWYARKYDQVTKLGRILDPFCDKILICGTYVLLAVKMADSQPDFPWWGRITGWVAVVVVGRELLVTVLRSMIEGSGGDFSANMSGKLKMWFQCIAVVTCMLALINVSSATVSDQHPPEAFNVLAQAIVPTWIWWTMVAFIWLSVLSTLQSGWVYIQSASQTILSNHAR